MEMSIKEYADLRKMSRFTVIKQIHEDRLPKGVKAKKVGNMFVLKIAKNNGADIAFDPI